MSESKKTSKSSSTKHKIRILSFNLWHGLNHSHPELMLPAQFPLKSWLRSKAQIKALQNFLSQSPESLNVILLQEANPVTKLSAKIKKEPGVEGVSHIAVNTGIRVGNLSYPPFLQEGLLNTWNNKLENTTSAGKILSGKGFDYQPAFGPPISAHLSERRGALKTSGRFQGRLFCFVNLHLHSGRTHKKSALRRASEIDNLMTWLEPELQSHDAIFIGGDFNCEHGEAEMAPMVAKGFEEILPPDGNPLITWDPHTNPLTAQVSNYSPDPGHREWDKQRHQLDHIYCWHNPKSWGKKNKGTLPWKSKVTRLFDDDQFGSWLSDHFALALELEWEEKTK